jgi:hypothetical protein
LARKQIRAGRRESRHRKYALPNSKAQIGAQDFIGARFVEESDVSG